MLLRRFTDFILQSHLQAMGVAFLLSFIPLVGGSLSILIAALVTLRKGAFAGTLVLCAAIVPYLLSYAYSASEQTQVMLIATTIIITINILTWLYALLLRRYNNWSLVIEIAALSGIIAVGVIYFIYPDVQNWWLAELAKYTNKMMEQAAADGAALPEEMQAGITASVQEFKRYATGILVVSILFNAVFQLILARWWQAIVFNPGGLRKELHQIRLSSLAVVVFIVVAGLAYAGQAFSLDILPIVVTAFCAGGLSLIHNLLMSNTAGWFWLTLVYLGVMFLSWMGIVVIAMAGVLDSLLDFRKRLGTMN